MESMPEPTVSISLTARDTSAALQFYVDAFGARELFRLPTPQGGVAHAEFMIGNSRIYISDEAEDWFAFAMPLDGTASCLFSIATDDCEKSCRRAIEAGAELLSKPADYFWGTKTALVKDPFGYRWAFNQKIEDVAPEELEKRAQAFFASSSL